MFNASRIGKESTSIVTWYDQLFHILKMKPLIVSLCVEINAEQSKAAEKEGLLYHARPQRML